MLTKINQDKIKRLETENLRLRSLLALEQQHHKLLEDALYKTHPITRLLNKIIKK
ncbi:MAG: hypothetical protein WC069_02225 [Candidatus Shapirobacteria bacterium]